MAHLSGRKSRVSWSVEGGAASVSSNASPQNQPGNLLGESEPALRSRKQYISREQARERQYRNNLQAYSFQGVAGGLRNAVVKGEMLCPVTFDENGKKKPMKAYKLPIPEWDKAMRQQWPILRKDMFNRTVTLFCYPDGDFDGYKFSNPPDGQEPVDLDDYKYIARVNTDETLETLGYLLQPKRSITKLEKDKAEVTALAVEFANEASLLRTKENAISQLAKILAGCRKHAGKPSSLKVSDSEKEAKELLEVVHAVAIATLSLDAVQVNPNDQSLDTEEKAKEAHCSAAGGVYGKHQVGSVTLEGCIAQSILDNVDNNMDFITPDEKRKVKKFLVEYSEKIEKLADEVKERNWKEAFLRASPRNKRLLSR